MVWKCNKCGEELDKLNYTEELDGEYILNEGDIYEGEHIPISELDNGVRYYCPFCSEELILEDIIEEAEQYE